MSIRSLTKADISRRSGRASNINQPGIRSSDASGKEAPNANDAIDIIMKYIPSEAIALYIAALPLLSSKNPAKINLPSFLNVTMVDQLRFLNDGINIDRWDIILIFSALTAFMVVLSYAGEYTKKNKDKKWVFSKANAGLLYGV